MIKFVLISSILLLVGCSEKGIKVSNEVVDKKDNIFYDFTEEKKIEDLKKRYGEDWRNHY